MALLEKPDRERGYNKERILRVLLNHTEEELTKYRVAKLAKVSEPWTRQYTDRLEEQGLLKNTTILKPKKLYEEWGKSRIQPNQTTVSLQQAMDLLADTELEYALTTYQAENLHQGFLFASSTDFYIAPDQIQDWIKIVKKKGMVGGGNTRIKVTDDHVFYQHQSVNEYTTVSIPQLIVDLLDEGGPCMEAAENLIEQYHH